MPQINEYSWMLQSTKLMIILMMMMISLNFTRKIILLTKLNLKQFFFQIMI